MSADVKKVIDAALISIFPGMLGTQTIVTDAILTALSSAGLAVVPVVPTDEMILALPLEAVDGLMGEKTLRTIWAKQVREDWAAMIAAAPPPLASGGNK